VCCSVLQCAAVCCSVLQCVAVLCIVLQCSALCCTWWQPRTRSEHSKPNIGRYSVAVCCSVLQCAAVCCSVLQCSALCCSCSVPHYVDSHGRDPNTRNQIQADILLQCAAVLCSVLQYSAVCCSALHCVAVAYSVLQLMTANNKHSTPNAGRHYQDKSHKKKNTNSSDELIIRSLISWLLPTLVMSTHS